MNNQFYQPLNVPIIIYNGSTFVEGFFVRWCTELETDPIDPMIENGDKAFMQIRATHHPILNNGHLLLDLTSDKGDIILDYSTGTVAIKIAPDKTEEITARRGKYDFEIHHSSMHSRLADQVTIIRRGVVTFVPNTTRYGKLNGYQRNHAVL